MTPSEFAEIEALAKLAREDTFRPGFPFGGTGEWTENLVELLGGPVGDFVGAVSPDVVDGLLAAVRERDNTIARVRELLREAEISSADENPYVYADELRAALDPQETP